MPVSPTVVFTKTMTSGVTELTFTVGGSYESYMVLVPTMTSGTDIRFKVAPSDSGTFRTLYHAPTVASATPTVVVIPSSVTNCAVNVPYLGENFKITLTTAMTATAVEFSVICKGT